MPSRRLVVGAQFKTIMLKIKVQHRVKYIVVRPFLVLAQPLLNSPLMELEAASLVCDSGRRNSSLLHESQYSPALGPFDSFNRTVCER